MNKQLLDIKTCILNLAKDGKSYQEIKATINILFDQEGLTTINVGLKGYNFIFQSHKQGDSCF